jgi:hypothetical protein
MVRDLAKASVCVGVLAAVAACSKTHAPAMASQASHNSGATVAVSDEAPAPAAIPHGTRKQLNLDIPVFVDGKQVAVLRYGELPPGVEPITIPSSEHHAVRFFRISDYLKGIGVNVDRVKAVHFADKDDRVAGLEGSELRADKDRFVFDFTSTTAGMPEMVWSTYGLKTGLRIDYFYAVNVFVDQKPWEIDSKFHCYKEDDGCRPVARYTPDDLKKGTRVYVDGKLVSYVKRRTLADSTLAGKTESGEPTFSMDKYLASLGIKTESAKRVNLVAGDKVVASASAKEWAADKDSLTFHLVQHAHGKVEANIPANLQLEGTTDRETQVTAIQVFNRKAPRNVPLVRLNDVIDLGALQSSGALAQSEPPDSAE